MSEKPESSDAYPAPSASCQEIAVEPSTPSTRKNLLRFTSVEFLPYFWTQALGAVNDNIFKNIVSLLFVYQGLSLAGITAATMANICAALFILPYILFSGYAGVLAERYDEARVIVWTKLAEVLVMALAALGFVLNSPSLLLLCVFLMGTQSTFYGPVKYSYLPSRLNKDDLTKANAWVEASTFIGILLGTLVAGLLVNGFGAALNYSVVVVALAAIGLVFALKVPGLPLEVFSNEKSPHQLSKIPGFMQSLLQMRDSAKSVESVWQSILGVSAFWLIGSIVLANLPAIAKDSFELSAGGLTWYLALFAVGVAVGSLVADKLSGRRLELGLVPLASLGLALSVYNMWCHAGEGNLYGFGLWLFFSGFFGGGYGVPLYALIQSRSPKGSTGRVISYLNFQNALFMVGGAIGCAALLALGAQAKDTLLLAVTVNVVACAVVFKKIPEFGFRLAVLVLARMFYSLRVKNHEIIPEEGACLLIGNHVTWIDAFFLSASCRRPPVYVMWWKLMTIPVLGWFLVNVCKAVPIAGKNENPEIYQKAFDTIGSALSEGRLCMIFPEGALTWDGELAEFKNGIFKILEGNPCPVYAFGMAGAWGTWFSRKNLKVTTKLKALRWRPGIGVLFSKVEKSELESAEILRAKVAGLIAEAESLL